MIIALVVTYNRLEKLQATIKILLDLNISNIVVVDNASFDGTELWLTSLGKQYPNLSIIRSDKNQGGAGGFELGLKYCAKNFENNWVICLDDDAYPASTGFDFLYNSLYQFDTKAIYLGSVFYSNNEICKMNKPMVMPSLFQGMKNFFSKKSMTALDESHFFKSEIVEVYAGSFVGMILNTKLLNEKNIFPDPSFFLYWDDIDFCLQHKKINVNIFFCPDIKFIHDCNRDAASLTSERFYYMVRNGYRVIKKLPLQFRIPSLIIKSIIWFLYSIKNKQINVLFKALSDI